MGLTALREAQVNAALLTGGGLGSQTEPKRRQKPNRPLPALSAVALAKVEGFAPQRYSFYGNALKSAAVASDMSFPSL